MRLFSRVVTAVLISLAVLLLIGPALAGQCVSEQEDNDSARLADRLGELPGAGCRVGAIDPSGDVDMYVFTVGVASDVVIETVTNGDTLLGLYDANGDLLAEDDDGGAGYASRIEGTLSAGTYLAVVVAYQDRTIAEYRITIEGDAVGGPSSSSSSSCAREQESNDSTALADHLAQVPGSGCRSGTISPSGDADVYSLVVTQTCRVVIETITDGDTVLRIYNEAGNFLGEDDDGGADSASRLAGTLSTGTYYVVVTGYDGGTVAAYDIRVDSEGHAAGDSTTSSNPPPSDGATGDGPPWGWSIVGDGIVFRAWGRIDKDCPSDYALGAGECDRDVYEIRLASGYVALALIDERGQWITAHLSDASGHRFLSKHGEASSIYSSWAAIGGGTYHVDVVPGKRLDLSSYELYVFYSATPQNTAYLAQRYGPAEREL